MTDTDLIARMEAGRDRALADAEAEEARARVAQERAQAARRRAADIDVAIRTALEFLESGSSPPSTNGAPAAPAGTGGESSPPPTGDGETASTKPSIREASVAIVARVPGKVWAAQDIADTLLAEGYEYPNDRKRLRETVSTVLKQHIKSELKPLLENPAPARFVLPQADVFGEQTSLVEVETADSGSTLTAVSEA